MNSINNDYAKNACQPYYLLNKYIKKKYIIYKNILIYFKKSPESII